MARDVLTVQDVSRTGLAVSYAAGDSANGHSFDNARHNVFLHIKNSDGSPVNATIITPNTVDGLAIGDLVVVIPATTGDVMIGPFPAALYDTVDSDPVPEIDPAIFVDLSADTGITLAAIKLPGASY
jgi:hypothetical protein